jgi:polar amino acid transport system substrate-binding protein
MVGSARRWRLLAGGLAMAFLLAACGSNKSSSGGGGSTATTKAPTVDQALAAKVPAAIKSDGTIKVGTDATYAPSEFLDTDGKTVIGFDVDLFNGVAAKLGLKAQYESAKFDAIIPGVQSGKYEIGVSSFTINPDRKKQVNMVSYFSAGTQWATKKGNPSGIQPDAACGKKVAVQTSTVQDTDDLPKRLKACTSSGKPTAAVVTGKDDAMLADSPVVAYAVKQSKGQLEALGSIYEAAPYGYVIKKDQTDFAQAISDAVSALISDGSYKTILEKWGVEAGGIEKSAVNPS